MKFLIVNGKFQKDASGNLITAPDNYSNEPLTLNGKLLKTSAGIIGSPQDSSNKNLWTLNSTLTEQEVSFTVNFTVIGKDALYTGFKRVYEVWDDPDIGPFVEDSLVMHAQPLIPNSPGDREMPYVDGSWRDESFRHLSFNAEPTGELLAWLQANGKPGSTAI